MTTYPLKFHWVFWFMHREKGSKVSYEDSLIKISTVSNLHQFWETYSFLKKPSELAYVSDLELFKQGIRPIWEDAENKLGGKWIIRLRKGLISRYWENLVFALIGDQIDVGDAICGIVVSVRQNEDILSVWNRDADNGSMNLKIKNSVKSILNLPPNTIMEYKAHLASVADNSSFRNTALYR